MGLKRPRDREANLNPSLRAEPESKKPRRGFAVGPGHLPDGTYRRKVKKIKDNLIHKAKVKKNYEKIKRREQAHLDEPSSSNDIEYQSDEEGSTLQAVNEEFLDGPANTSTEEPVSKSSRSERPQPKAAAESAGRDDPEMAEEGHQVRLDGIHPQRRGKLQPFAKEMRQVAQRRAAKEQRQKDIARMNEEREQKRQEREKFRKAMAKARSGGKNGQRKLGRESEVLLSKVQRMMQQ